MIIYSIAVVFLLVVACVGYGAFWLKVLGVPHPKSWAESWTISFTLGLGTLGWVLFWFGISHSLVNAVFIGVVMIGCICFITLRTEIRYPQRATLDHKTLFLLVVFLVCVGVDTLEAFAPPADADTLAYHFAIPKKFLGLKSIEFIPYAVDGAIPLLVHLTYTIALGLGGELTLNLWVYCCQLFLILGVYAVARRKLPRFYSMMISLVLLTTAGIIFAGGTGQIEPKTALFMLFAAVAVADGLEQDQKRYLVLGGILAGFFMASKYLGLFAVASFLLLMLFYSPRVNRISIFGVSALASGFQWYAWNTLHTGMPVFPTMFSWGLTGWGDYWNPEIDAAFASLMAGCNLESLFAVVSYPFLATLHPQECWDNQRTGLGPYFWFLTPAVIFVTWKAICSENKVTDSFLFRLIFPATGFYLLWVAIPGIGAITRYLVPIYPLLLIAVSSGIYAYMVRHAVPWLRYCLTTSMTLSIIIGSSIQFLYGQNYIKFHLSSETRDEFYRRNISYYEGIEWVNKNLSRSNKLAHQARYHNYLLSNPYILISPRMQVMIPPDGVDDIEQIRRAFCEQKVEYLMFVGERPPYRNAFNFEIVFTERSRQILSRTIANLSRLTGEKLSMQKESTASAVLNTESEYQSGVSISVARLKWEEIDFHQNCVKPQDAG